MKTMTRFTLALILLTSAIIASASVPPEQRLMIERKIEDELKQSLMELVSEERIAQRLGFELPVKEPSMTLTAVEARAEQRIREMAVEKYPNTWVNQELRKVAAQFATWKPGQMVTARTKDGREIREYLRAITPFSITVGPVELRRDELSPETLLRIDEARAAEARNQLRSRLQMQLLALREAHVREIRLQQMREFYMDEGYMRIRGRWTPKHEYFQQKLEEERNKYSELLRPALSYKHYYNAGFREFKGEWYTPEEAARLRLLDRIERELQPIQTMALMDTLNQEFLAQVDVGQDEPGGGLFDEPAPATEPFN